MAITPNWVGPTPAQSSDQRMAILGQSLGNLSERLQRRKEYGQAAADKMLSDLDKATPGGLTVALKDPRMATALKRNIGRYLMTNKEEEIDAFLNAKANALMTEENANAFRNAAAAQGLFAEGGAPASGQPPNRAAILAQFTKPQAPSAPAGSPTAAPTPAPAPKAGGTVLDLAHATALDKLAEGSISGGISGSMGGSVLPGARIGVYTSKLIPNATFTSEAAARSAVRDYLMKQVEFAANPGEEPKDPRAKDAWLKQKREAEIIRKSVDDTYQGFDNSLKASLAQKQMEQDKQYGPNAGVGAASAPQASGKSMEGFVEYLKKANTGPGHKEFIEANKDNFQALANRYRNGTPAYWGKDIPGAAPAAQAPQANSEVPELSDEQKLVVKYQAELLDSRKAADLRRNDPEGYKDFQKAYAVFEKEVGKARVDIRREDIATRSGGYSLTRAGQEKLGQNGKDLLDILNATDPNNPILKDPRFSHFKENPAQLAADMQKAQIKRLLAAANLDETQIAKVGDALAIAKIKATAESSEAYAKVMEQTVKLIQPYYTELAKQTDPKKRKAMEDDLVNSPMFNEIYKLTMQSIAGSGNGSFGYSRETMTKSKLLGLIKEYTDFYRPKADLTPGVAPVENKAAGISGGDQEILDALQYLGQQAGIGQ